MNRFSGKCEITEFAENQEEAEKQDYELKDFIKDSHQISLFVRAGSQKSLWESVIRYGVPFIEETIRFKGNDARRKLGIPLQSKRHTLLSDKMGFHFFELPNCQMMWMRMICYCCGFCCSRRKRKRN